MEKKGKRKLKAKTSACLALAGSFLRPQNKTKDTHYYIAIFGPSGLIFFSRKHKIEHTHHTRHMLARPNLDKINLKLVPAQGRQSSCGGPCSSDDIYIVIPL